MILEIDEEHQIFVEKAKDTFLIECIFGIDNSNDLNIEKWTDKFIDEMFPKTIIIADSIQHGFIVMCYDDENKGIYYWDDTYYFRTSNDNFNTYKIANTFSELIKLISIKK